MWRRRLRGPFAALVLVVSILSPAAPSALAQAPPPWFAISDVRIVTGTGEIIPRGTIVVRDGLIESIGADVTPPAGAWTLEADGLTAYPGLIDALTNIALPSELRAPARAPGGGGGRGTSGSGASQEGTSRGPEDRPATFTWVTAADHLESDDSRIEAWRKAGFTTVVSSPDRGLLPGQAAVIDLAGERPNDMVVRTPVAVRVKFTKSRSFRGYPNSLMGAIAYVKQVFFDARHYDKAWSIYDASPAGTTRPQYDRALEALRGALATRQPVLFPADWGREIERVIAIARELGVTPIIYGGRQGYAVAELLAAADIPVLVNLDWPKRDRDADPDADEPLRVLRYRDRAPTTPAALHAAGARFAFTSGAISDPSQILTNARLAVRAGLPAEAALRAFTLGAAEIFGVADRTGSLESGKIANIVLADGDLFAPGTTIHTVIVDGHRFDGASVDGAVTQADGPDADAEQNGGQSDPDTEQENAESDQDAGPYEPIPMVRDRGPVRTADVTLIRNGTILTVSGERIEGGDILIRNGKIAQVGRGIEAPSDAYVIDASERYVIPGIIDAHSHIAAEAINEGSVSVSAMVSIRDVLNPDQVAIYRALAGGVTVANILHGSANPIGGQNAVIKLRWGGNASRLLMQGAMPGIKFALGENTKRDRDPDRYPASRMGVMDVIRTAFLEAREYRDDGRRYEQALADGRQGVIPPRRNLKLDPLVEILEGRRYVHAHSYRADEILQLLRLAEEFGFRIRTLQHVLEGYRIADEIAEHGAGASTFSDWWAYKIEAYEAIPYNAALMTERGVLVSINSDSGEEMRHLNQEAAKTMKWGGTDANAALRMVTLNPAIQLGIDDRVGSIEVGKDADLVLYRGHPLSVYGVVEMTLVDGQVYFDRTHDARMRRELAEEKQKLIEHQAKAPKGRDRDRRRPTDRSQAQETSR